MKTRASNRPAYSGVHAKPIIIVEMLEETPSRWLAIELKESRAFAKLYGHKLLATGVNSIVGSLLESAGVETSMERGFNYNRPDCILLDLEAPRTLEPWEAANASAIIVGGIMGDYPPRGRTYLLRSQIYTSCAARNLGPDQLSIDGAVKTAVLISSGYRLGEIEFKREISIRIPLGSGEIEAEVVLPFAYPVLNGEVLISKDLASLLAKGITYDDETLML